MNSRLYVYLACLIGFLWVTEDIIAFSILNVMSFITAVNIMPDILVFIYFFTKDFILAKLFRKSDYRVHPVVTLGLSLAAVFMNGQLVASYGSYLDMFYVKGAIVLPHFTILFITADFISSIIILAALTARFGSAFFRIRHARLVVDVIRLAFVYFVFTTIASMLWVREVKRNMNGDFQCFKYQVTIDLISYYYRNDGMPSKLGEFTTYTVNPVNNSPLVYSPGSELHTMVTDEMGNKIFEGYKDLAGVDVYKDTPSDFFSSYRIMNKTMCSGTLKIPPEFDKEPTWMQQ